MSYGLNLGWEGPIDDYTGFWGGTYYRRYTTNSVKGLRVLDLEVS